MKWLLRLLPPVNPEDVGRKLEREYPELRDHEPALKTVTEACRLYGASWMHDASIDLVYERLKAAYCSWKEREYVQAAKAMPRADDGPYIHPPPPPPRKPWWRRLFG